ncbi:MAG: hypothetical protein ACO39U_03820 [Bacteroidia bacterium]
MHQHGNYEHHVYNHDGNGCDSNGLTGGCYGFMEFKHGNDQRHTDGIGAIYLHSDDDRRLYGGYKYDNGNN